MATKFYCSRYEREVEFYGNHCLGFSLFPFNVGECPSRINLNNYDTRRTIMKELSKLSIEEKAKRYDRI